MGLRGARTRVGPGLRLTVILLKPVLLAIMKRDWRGVEHLHDDEGGIVIAANHMSWLDPLVISHVLVDNARPPRFLAKEAVFSVPFVGWVLRDAGQIPVYRESADAAKSVSAAVAAAKAGECVIVYPEGTLTRDPDLWPMSAKTGAVRIALESGRPLIPLAHWGVQDVMRPYKKELRILPRKQVHVMIGAPVDLADFAGMDLTPDVLRAATDRLMDAITELVSQMRGERPPDQRFVWRGRKTEQSTEGGAS